jgi:hypothetical protein
VLGELEPCWIGMPQHVFIDWATDAKIPLPTWQRLQYLALGRCDDTGVASFKRGELARLLYGGPDKHRNLTHHIDSAIRYRVLSRDSCRTFLRVPEYILRSAPSAGYAKRVEQSRKSTGNCVDAKRFSSRKASLANAS